MLLLLLTAVSTSCRLQHTKVRKKSDFDDGEGAEKVSSIPNLQCKCCSSLIVVSVNGCQGVGGMLMRPYLRPLTWTSGCVASLIRNY